MSETTEQTPSLSVADVLDVLDLRQIDTNRWQGDCVGSEGPVVFGGQLIGQALVAATAQVPGKRVSSAHSLFARTGNAEHPVTFDVEPMHDGRSFASLSVTARQGERLLARSLMLLDAPQEDLIRHQSDAPTTAGPEAAHRQQPTIDGWDVRFLEDVDLFSVDVVGPPELAVWSRFATERQEPVVAQALISWASVGNLIGTALRPHPGFGQDRAHRDISTGVLTHSLTFHDDFTAGEWLLLSQRSAYTGGGKAFGVGQVFTEDGRLVVGYAQESMIRSMNPGSKL
jgi:acyl-CoA thioesterase II